MMGVLCGNEHVIQSQNKGTQITPKKGLKITKDPGNNDGRDGEKQHHEEENSTSNEGLLALLVNNHQDCFYFRKYLYYCDQNIKCGHHSPCLNHHQSLESVSVNEGGSVNIFY